MFRYLLASFNQLHNSILPEYFILLRKGPLITLESDDYMKMQNDIHHHQLCTPYSNIGKHGIPGNPKTFQQFQKIPNFTISVVIVNKYVMMTITNIMRLNITGFPNTVALCQTKLNLMNIKNKAQVFTVYNAAKFETRLQ